jgi:ribosome-associated protein
MPLTDQHGQYIELNTFLKIKNQANSGGQAKQLIQSERVKVNKQVETRVRRKLRNDDTVEVNEEQFKVDMKEF